MFCKINSTPHCVSFKSKMTVNLLMAMIFSIGIVSKRSAVSKYQNSYLTPNLREIKQNKVELFIPES